jgi:hypothetical protein
MIFYEVDDENRNLRQYPKVNILDA